MMLNLLKAEQIEFICSLDTGFKNEKEWRYGSVYSVKAMALSSRSHISNIVGTRTTVAWRCVAGKLDMIVLKQ